MNHIQETAKSRMIANRFISIASRRKVLSATLLIAVELLAIALIYKDSINFNCRKNWPERICGAADTIIIWAYFALAALALFAMFYPSALRALTARTGERNWPLGLHFFGALIVLLPVILLHNGQGTAMMLPSFACWTVGLGFMLCGLGAYLAPAAHWIVFLREHSLKLMLMFLAGVSATFLSKLIQPIWQVETISDATFNAVSTVVRSIGYDVATVPSTKIIGTSEFAINVAPQCSGIEGLALVTLFVSLYLWLFRADLRFPHALLLYPIGLVASASFNVLRISILLIIGLEGNSELAVGGFHSHAGWLMFTLVALGIIGVAQTVSWLRAPDVIIPAPEASTRSESGLTPLSQDPVAAHILPFAIFMLSALLAQTFSQSPGVVYPLRVLAMAAALLFFYSIYTRLPWRIDPVAIGAGLAVGLIWVLVPVEAGDAPPPYSALTGALLTGWLILRGLGTIFLVPVIEELFFRGYLEKLFTRNSELVWRCLAAVLTAVLFAALHDRIVEAFVAGLIFSWIAQRRGNITDAILAHGVANALVYAVALATGQMHII